MNVAFWQTWKRLLLTLALALVLGSSAFAQGRIELSALPRPILQLASDFLQLNQGTREFEGKRLFAAVPVYASGVGGVAYYEVWLTKDGQTPRGWLLLSATSKDYPLVNFSHDGTPYSQKAVRRAKQAGLSMTGRERVYRFGVSYFSVEDRHGNLLGDYGEMPRVLSRHSGLSASGAGDSEHGVLFDTAMKQQPVEGIDFDRVHSYDELRKLFPASYFTPGRAKQAAYDRGWVSKALRTQRSQPASAYNYFWIDDNDNEAFYKQMPANTGYNGYNCFSGCNNNAWTSIYGWWDKNRGKSALIPTTSTGETCATYNNTSARKDAVDPVQMWLRSVCHTSCGNGTGWTSWSDAHLGYRWADNKGYGWDYSFQWCEDPGCDVYMQNVIANGVGIDRRPVHIGANSHFYVGHGFRQWDTDPLNSWVYGYPGWDYDHSADVWIRWQDLNSATQLNVY